jgi:hypothetical protein
MVIRNPFIERGTIQILFIIIGGFLTSGLILIPYFLITYYFKKKKENYTNERIKGECSEFPQLQIKSYLENVGFGQLGLTENYLFFVPKNKQEESIIVNVRYLTSFNARTVPTGEYTTTTDFDGSKDTSPKKAPIFEITGKTDEGLDFQYIWVTGTVWNKNNRKLYNLLNTSNKVSQNIKLNRKLL